MSQHLTLRQAARLLAVSQTTLRRMIERGQLPGELHPGPFGERWMVPQEALERFLAERSGAPGVGGGVGEAPGVPSGGAGGVVEGAPDGVPGEGGVPGSGAGGAAGPPLQESGGVGEGPESGAPGAGPSIPLETLERALELAHRHLDRAQELEADLAVERERALEARDRAARAERQAEELRYVLTQHQRALAEAAESLVEERARAMAAEFAAAQPPQQLTIDSQDIIDGAVTGDEARFLRTGRTTRPSWGFRFRRWLLGERTGS